jgi:hypothetical protein
MSLDTGKKGGETRRFLGAIQIFFFKKLLKYFQK